MPLSSDSSILADDSDEDHRLIALTASGDDAAFERLVRKHQGRVFSTVYRMLPGEAEDLTQQVFLRIWKAAPRYRPDASFTTWLYRITRNVVFNEVRHRRSRPPSAAASQSLVENEASGERPEEQLPDDRTQSPGSALATRELEAAIQAAIDALPEQQRMALVLRRYEELPYEQIAEVMETTVSSVKSLLFRARDELKQRLARYLAD